jgi:Xaa-Pro aminopeptidase
LAEKLVDIAPHAELLDIRHNLAELRMVKQAPELAALQEAIKVTSESLEALTGPEKFTLYHNEYEVEADLGREFRIRGAAGHAFAPIVAGGKRACTLHNVSNEAPLLPDTLVVLDIGAEVEHYAADITRTLAYGEASARQQEVFNAVLDVQNYALSLLKPGVLLKEYEAEVEKYMGETLVKLKLIELGDDVDANHEAIRQFYPHATSHFLGLDVHDVGDYAQPLRPDMVLTCEPGIYIPAEGIGVRIEDDVIITEEGHRVLSADLPKTLV